MSKPKKENKYTKKLGEYLAIAEVRPNISVRVWVYNGKPKWTVTETEKMDDREISISYEGDNLEVLLKKVLF